MRSAGLLLFGIHLAFAGTRSLQYFCTVVYGDINIPTLTVVGVVDGQQFMYFDTVTNKAVPKTEWMRHFEGPDYWDRDTQVVIDRYNEHKTIMESIMKHYNQSMSKDVNTFQMMYGCELDDDGTTQGDLQYGYNGDDLISFDRKTHKWTAGETYPAAVNIMKQWDTGEAKTTYWKAYLESMCFERINKFVSYGKDTLERKVAPEVSLLQKNSSSPVICHATGFYPKNITMTWKRNNEDLNEDVVSKTLPNQDGTFQKSISLSVKSEEWKKNPDVYRCVIQHVAAEKEIVVTLNENNIKSNSASDNIIVKYLVYIYVVAVVGCVLAFTVLAVTKRHIVCRKCRDLQSTNGLWERQ
ncbi:Major histocompatibility complex class I-related gene protein [Triplophysa tibetana]|uniref:Major histocompatibility complex class I-related gene protein n=1 Tax=Triplophysa tibetana TaxID=1572043 RepID=A0A5A9NMA7_9TELE|nr:Major histocompatibility complex class I-related gene protein [Triplophysa tibetana]KAA0710054.1 Major histocompatibility complex class I-related gene protein [Triplophysa tibetana]